MLLELSARPYRAVSLEWIVVDDCDHNVLSFRRVDRRGRELLTDHPFPDEIVTIAVPRGRTSAMVGQKKRNLTRLCREFSLKKIKVIEIDKLLGYNIKIVHPREEERDPCI